jgi:ribose transport system permease protein
MNRGLMMPRSLALIWLNLALTLIVAAIGFGLGFAQGLSAQLVILYTVITVAVLFLLLNYVTVIFESRQARADTRPAELTGRAEPNGARGVWRNNRAQCGLAISGYA